MSYKRRQDNGDSTVIRLGLTPIYLCCLQHTRMNIVGGKWTEDGSSGHKQEGSGGRPTSCRAWVKFHTNRKHLPTSTGKQRMNYEKFGVIHSVHVVAEPEGSRPKLWKSVPGHDSQLFPPTSHLYCPFHQDLFQRCPYISFSVFQGYVSSSVHCIPDQSDMPKST